MLSRRLNIMLYSSSGGEQIILPINPEKIDIKYEKTIQNFDVIGFGQVNVMGNPSPLRINLSHFLPEDDSIFNTNSSIMYDFNGSSDFIEYSYTSKSAVDILKKWALEKTRIRLLIDDELNIECMVVSFTETIRESISSKPYVLELLEYRNPSVQSQDKFGLIRRVKDIFIPKAILMKVGDTAYSIADRYGLDFKSLAEKNGIDDLNKEYIGKKIYTSGVKKSK